MALDLDIHPGEETELDPAAADAAAKPSGPFQMEEGALVKHMRRWFKESSDKQKARREERKTEWKNLAGDQWEETDLQRMVKAKRPALTLNMLLTILAAVEGEERSNRQELKCYGEGQEDDQAAYALNRFLKWVINQCGGEFAFSDQFRHGAAVGEGWVVPEVDYFTDPEGVIRLKHVDEDEIFDDPYATCPVSSDSRYMIRGRMIAEDELEARWPGSPAKLKDAAEMDDHVGTETDGAGFPDIYLTPNDTASPKLYDQITKKWFVMECWWFQIEPGHVVVNEQTGALEEKTATEFEQLKAQRTQEQRAHIEAIVSGQPPMVQAQDPATGQPMLQPAPFPKSIDAAERPIRCIYQAFVAYDVLLERKKIEVRGLKRFPYVPFRAIRDKVKGTWFGILKSLLDPQKQHNVEQSALVQLVQLMPKQAWFGPKGSFHNKHEWMEKIAQPGAMLEYNGQKGKPEPVPAPVIPRHLVDMAFSRPASMREISGVNTEMTGQRVGSDAGIVMEQRRKAAQTVLAPIFDNFRRSKIEVGRVLLAYIQTFIKPGRKQRILGPEGPAYESFTEEMGLLQFDIMIDEANATVNDRIASLQVLQTTLPQIMKAGLSVPPEMVDLMPMPPHVRTAWKRQISWDMARTGALPPPGWQPGMPVPMPGAPPGLPAPAGGPAAQPAPAQ